MEPASYTLYKQQLFSLKMVDNKLFIGVLKMLAQTLL